MLMSLWQNDYIPTAVLPSCVWSSEWDVTDGKLNAWVHQRSCDVPLGLPFNVTQYATLLCMIAQVCDMEAGELLHVIADCHIYDRHIPIIKELIEREPYPAPTVRLNPEIRDFYQFTTDDLIVENYQTGPQVKDIPIAV